MSSSDRVRYVLLIAFIPFLDNTIIPHIILKIYSSYLIYVILETGTVYSDYAVIPFDMNKVKVFDENGTRVIEDYEELKEWWNNEE